MANDLKCKTCIPPERYPGCHDKCKYYQEWKEIHDKEKELEHKQKWLDTLGRPEKPIRKR